MLTLDMLEYLVTLALGIWLGVSVFLYIACAWVEDKLDLPSRRDGSSAGVSEGASGAHARLKRLVARAAEEAATLPALRHRASIAPPSKDFRADTYEDLLATAILNKVIDAYQQQECGSSGVHSASDSAGSARAPTAGRSRSPSSHEPFSHDDGSQSDSSGAPRSDSGVRRGRPERGDRTLFRQYSSEEERLAHQPRAAAAHSTRHDNPVDDALANIDFSQSIIPFPEFGRDIIDVQENDICFGEESGYEKDNISNGDIHAVNNTWEENWLFQKRRIKTPQAVPVPMLVPNSTADFRALIGDRDAEDTTDLSELGSDSDDDISITTDLKQVLVTSKTLIGGKNGRNINSRNVDISVDKDELDSSAVVSNMFNGGNESIECGVIPFYKSFNGEDEFQNSIDDSKQQFAVEEYGKVFIDVNSGPLTKTEFTVSEIHRVSNEMDDTNSLIDDEDNHVIKGNEYEVENLNGTIAATDEFDIEMKSLDTSWPEHKKDVTEATNFDVLDAKENDHTLSSLNHQKESEYTETIAMPVQRHDDSLRRDYHARACELTASPPVTTPPTAAPRSRSSGIQCENKYSEEEDLSIIPGSIADRERKKWLNSVPMPNNPYSAEAIEKRLSSNSTSAIFDILTSGKDIERNVKSKDQNDNHIRESKAPTKILKDVLAEEVPQYKRYGRDYYINEAKKSTGARKRNGDLEAEQSLSTSNRSQSLEQFNADDNTSSVSHSSSLSDFEATALHHNIVRVVLSPRNASPNFALNPLYDNREEKEDPSDMRELYHSTPNRKTRQGNFNKIITNNNTPSKTSHTDMYRNGDRHSINDDSLRLKIPNKPEIVETTFESLKNILGTSTVRSDSCSKVKKRSGINNTFGGSLRFYPNVNKDLW